ERSRWRTSRRPVCDSFCGDRSPAAASSTPWALIRCASCSERRKGQGSDLSEMPSLIRAIDGRLLYRGWTLVGVIAERASQALEGGAGQPHRSPFRTADADVLSIFVQRHRAEQILLAAEFPQVRRAGVKGDRGPDPIHEHEQREVIR